MELLPATFSWAPNPEGAQRLAAELSKLTKLQSLELHLSENELGPGPQSFLEGAEGGSEVLVPFSFWGGFSEQEIKIRGAVNLLEPLRFADWKAGTRILADKMYNGKAPRSNAVVAL